MKLPKPMKLPRTAAKAKEGHKTAAVEAQEEVSETLRAFNAARLNDKARTIDTTDSEYWVAFVFESRAHKEAFLEATKLLAHGDKYIDGHAIADVMGVKLPARRAARGHRKFAPRWTGLAEELPSAAAGAARAGSSAAPTGDATGRLADGVHALCSGHDAENEP